MFIDHRLPATALAFCLSAGAACATTVETTVEPAFVQSPINIVTADAEYRDDLPPLVFNYASSARLGIVDTRPSFLDDENATVRADVCPVCGLVHAAGTADVASSLMIGDITYDLLQFHLHAPGEHQIDGQAGAMELHLVHQARNADGTPNPEGALAVVGQIIRIGETANEALAPYFDALEGLGETVANGQLGAAIEVLNFNLAALIPGDRSTYRYTGSLTAPPANNEELEEFPGPVAWNIFAEGITVSNDQFEAFKGLFFEEEVFIGNARPVQGQGAPEVLTDVAPIPLPASGVLFLFALGGMAALRRRAA